MASDHSSSRLNFTSCKIEIIMFVSNRADQVSWSTENLENQRGSLHGGFSFSFSLGLGPEEVLSK